VWFWIDIRFSRSRGRIETNVKSTAPANRGRIGADASSVKVLRPCLAAGNAGLALHLACLFASHKRRIHHRHCGSIIDARAFGRGFSGLPKKRATHCSPAFFA
jgi:hypothetical protein